MPSRGSYQIASQDQRKAVQRDESYRSCVATLLIFFMLCMVILLACIPWRRNGTSQYNRKEGENAALAHDYDNKASYDDEPIETNIVVTTTIAETTMDVSTDVLVQNYIPVRDTNQSFERYYENITTRLDPLNRDTTVESIFDTVSTLADDIKSTNLQNQNKTTVGKTEITKQPELRYNNISNTISFNNYEISESTMQENISTMPAITMSDVTTKNSYETETNIEMSEYSTVSMYNTTASEDALFIHSTPKNIYTTTDELNDLETTTSKTTFSPIINSSDLFTVTDSTLENNNVKTSEITKEFSTTYEPQSASPFFNYFTSTTLMEIENTTTQETIKTTESAAAKEASYTTNINTISESNIFTTNTPEDGTNTCTSGNCKQVAARILSYMNHSADPCEDFYEYACGGMIADPQIIDLNLDNKAYDRISKQMRNHSNDAALLFATYYNSCMQYENTISMEERIAFVKEAINKVGKFYTVRDKVDSYEDFTTTYATLLHYSSLLFDVEPDLNEYNPSLYTISIGPVLHKDLFDSDNIDDFNNVIENEIQKPFVDLGSIYENYTEWKQNNGLFIKSITDALMVLGVFNDTGDIEQNVGITAYNIDTEIVQGFFSKFPSQAKIREAYLKKNYSRVLMEQLNKITKFINWDRLTFMLIKNNVDRNAYVQVYFYEELKNGLRNLENFWQTKPMNFHNAILGLYAYKLYRDLVVAKHKDMKQHCLRVSTNLLGPEASSLYMSSLSDKEIEYMNRTVKTFFNELKETLRSRKQTKRWITDEHHQTLLNKINDLSLAVPEISYFQYKKDNELYLSDNYINNSLILMKRYRSSIYSVIPSRINPGTPKQIWTRYATPYQSKGVVVYGLNLVIIPYGAIDYGNLFIENYEALPNYLIWATIGNLIARQMSHHFDVNGMYYWNKTRHDNTLLTNSDDMNYMNCQQNYIYEDQINMTLPLTSQIISFKISGHTLNARLSEIMGLRLTYDTLERLKLFSKDHLPWLELNVKQLFYLTYAQMYCTKSLLTTSYISLHENEELPSRIRVFVSASSDDLLGKSWNCPQGSQILPSFSCDSLSANKTFRTLAHTLLTNNYNVHTYIPSQFAKLTNLLVCF